MTVRDVEVGDGGDYVCVAMAERYINIARITLTVRGKSMVYIFIINMKVEWLIFCRRCSRCWKPLPSETTTNYSGLLSANIKSER